MRAVLTEELAFGRGMIVLSEAPGLRHTIRRAVSRGELRLLLPGVYVATDRQPDALLRARAMMRVDPGAVITGAAAARLHGWQGVADPAVCDVATSFRGRSPDYRFSRRRIPVEQVVSRDGVRFASMALTALHLARQLGGGPLDEALRSGVRLADLWEALEQCPGSPGNSRVRQLLADSRDEPWSEAERAAHRALRAARVRGWVANQPLLLAGRRRYLDLAFPQQRVAVEIDGRGFHCTWDQRVADMARDRELAAAGWRVLRFPAALVFAEPDRFVREVMAAVSWGAHDVPRAAA
nr:DUF559 domain-containing protein [Propionibacterium sp.]